VAIEKCAPALSGAFLFCTAGFFFCASLFARFPFCFQEFISVLPLTSILESSPDRSLAERLFSVFSAFSGLPVCGLSEVAKKYFWHGPVPSAGRLKPAPTKRKKLRIMGLKTRHSITQSVPRKEPG